MSVSLKQDVETRFNNVYQFKFLDEVKSILTEKDDLTHVSHIKKLYTKS